MNYKRKLMNYLPHSNNADSAKVAVALLAGVAVGAILGVLFAPESGHDTRYRISDKAKGLANSAKDKFQEAKDKLRPGIDNLANKKDQTVGAVKSKARTATTQVKNYANGVAETAGSSTQNGSAQGS